MEVNDLTLGAKLFSFTFALFSTAICIFAGMIATQPRLRLIAWCAAAIGSVNAIVIITT